MFPEPSRRQTFAVATCALLMVVIGCAADEPPPSPALDNETSAAVLTEPARERIDGPAPEIGEAEAAFRTMTMENPDPDAWSAAYQKLEEIGAPALPVLLEGLKSELQMTREMASSVLAQFGARAESAADDLIAALDDESTFVRANVATALLQMPDHVDGVVPVFAQILAGEDAELRRTAATNLASIETAKVRPLVPQLIAALGDSDREVVFSVTQLLGRIGPDAADALPKLRVVGAEGDDDLQAAVATAILLIDPEIRPE